MGKKFKPIYQCDLCGQEFEDPDMVRLFKGDVVNGEELKRYVNIEKYTMSCIECLPKLLIENFEIITPKQEIVNEISEKTSIKKSITESIKKTTKPEKKIVEPLSEPEIKDSEEISSEEPPTENIPKETEIEQPVVEVQEDETQLEEENEYFLTDGKYLILYKITNSEHEKLLAQEYGHKDFESLRKACGRSLIGIYFATDNYINELPENLSKENHEVINMVLLGVPNIVKKDIYILSDELACIEKEKFNLQIESIQENKPKQSQVKQESNSTTESEEDVSETSFFDMKELFEDDDDLNLDDL